MKDLTLLTAGQATTGSAALQAAIIAGIFGLTVALLTILGSFFLEGTRRRIADRRWLLDRRHEAYVTFVGLYTESNNLIEKYRATKSKDAYRAASDAHLQMGAAMVSINLVGTDKASDISKNVYRTAGQLIRSIRDDRDDGSAFEEMTGHLADFVNEVRVEFRSKAI